MTNDLDPDRYLSTVHSIGLANHRLITQLEVEASRIQQSAARGDDNTWADDDLRAWRRRVDVLRSQLRRDATALRRLADANRRVKSSGVEPGSGESSSGRARDSHYGTLHPFKDARSQEEFVARLNRVFALAHNPGCAPYSNSEFLAYMRSGGSVVSAPYLSQLRNGQRARPSLRALEGIAYAFRIDVRYFTDSGYADELEDDWRALELVHNPTVKHLTAKLLSLPEPVRDQVLRKAEASSDQEQTETGSPVAH